MNREQLTREVTDLQGLLQRKTNECVDLQAALHAARSEKDRVREDYEKRVQQVSRVLLASRIHMYVGTG